MEEIVVSIFRTCYLCLKSSVTCHTLAYSYQYIHIYGNNIKKFTLSNSPRNPISSIILVKKKAYAIDLVERDQVYVSA